MDSFEIKLGTPDQCLEEIIEFLARIFGPNYYQARKIQNTVIKSEPSTRPDNFVIARSNRGELIGVVRIVERRMIIGAAVLDCGGISSVSVHPDWRRRGINHSLMETAIKEMARRGMDMTYLYSRRAMDGYYTRFGYYGINRYLTLEIISSGLCEESLCFSPLLDCNLATIRRYYEDTYHNLGGSIRRDEKIWQFLSARIEVSPDEFVILECRLPKSDELVGYAIASKDQLVELSLPDAHFGNLTLALANAGIKFISIHPRHPYYQFVRMNHSTITHERFSLDGGYMARVLDQSSLISKLSGDICRRAREIGSGNTKIHIAGSSIDLGSGQVSNDSQPDDVAFEKPGQLMQFLLGMHDPRDYLCCHINPKKPWLKYIFASSGFHTGALDEI